jgi:hypothetical protein
MSDANAPAHTDEYKKAIEDYTTSVISSFQQFRKFGGFDKAKIDYVTVADLVERWYQDIIKYSASNIVLKLETKYIQTALWMYWIVKTKPIYFIDGDSERKQDVQKQYKNAINEHFAFEWCMNHLNADQDWIDATREPFVQSLYYTDIAPENLFLVLTLYCKHDEHLKNMKSHYEKRWQT